MTAGGRRSNFLAVSEEQEQEEQAQKEQPQEQGSSATLPGPPALKLGSTGGDSDTGEDSAPGVVLPPSPYKKRATAAPEPPAPCCWRPSVLQSSEPPAAARSCLLRCLLHLAKCCGALLLLRCTQVLAAAAVLCPCLLTC